MGYLKFLIKGRIGIFSQAGFLGLGWLLCLFLPATAEAQAPKAEFVADYTEVSQTQYVNFTDISTNNPDVWNWRISPSTSVTFVNGTSNVSSNATVRISEPGVYT